MAHYLIDLNKEIGVWVSSSGRMLGHLYSKNSAYLVESVEIPPTIYFQILGVLRQKEINVNPPGNINYNIKSWCSFVMSHNPSYIVILFSNLILDPGLKCGQLKGSHVKNIFPPLVETDSGSVIQSYCGLNLFV